jgi:hypothetical protein
MVMKRADWPVKIFRSFEEQESWEIGFYIAMTPKKRQRIARELRERYYGFDAPPVRKPRAEK